VVRKRTLGTVLTAGYIEDPFSTNRGRTVVEPGHTLDCGILSTGRVIVKNG